ncbi:MAG: hypothetical protein C4K58_06390 [Flavobacteriaceae bacterium]|nr:MAG: hypothetical protein C4K58_06390 [Flavobacteriaceae bacterium]
MKNKIVTPENLMIISFIICVSSIFYSLNNDKKRVRTESIIGVVEDVSVIPTSWNEPVKVQIKTDEKFIIVRGSPQVSIGKSLIVEKNGEEIKEIKDSRGKWFKVY